MHWFSQQSDCLCPTSATISQFVTALPQSCTVYGSLVRMTTDRHQNVYVVVTTSFNTYLRALFYPALSTLVTEHISCSLGYNFFLVGSFDWVGFCCPTQHKIGHFGYVPQANLLVWRGKTKPNTTKVHIHQSKEMYYKIKKIKARFSWLLTHPAWKWRGPILILALHKFVTHILT